jgi:AI-2 transport protein TqsA
MTPVNTSAGTRFLLGAAGLVILVAGLRAAAPILVPLVLAVFITVVNYPLLQYLRGLRVPTPVAVLSVVLLTFTFLGLIVLIGSSSLSDVQSVLPVYQERIKELEIMALNALEPLEARGFPVPDGRSLLTDMTEPERLMDLLSGAVVRAAGFVSSAAIVILFTVFMLSEATGFPAKLRTAIGRGDADLSRFAGAVRDIQRYLAIKTAISLATGALVALWLASIGVDFPLLWGMLAFLFNFVPNVGSLIAAIPAVLFTLLILGPWTAVLAALGYIIVNVALGNLLEPHLMGRRFGLSTMVVIISLVFWGWLWGPVGMLLSVPLTVVVRIGLEYTDDLRWLAVLLSNDARPSSVLLGAEGRAASPAAGPEVEPIDPSGLPAVRSGT